MDNNERQTKVRKWRKTGINLVFYVLITYLFAVLMFPNLPFLGRYHHYIILTDSMSPVIDPDSLVVIDRKVSVKDFNEGDIIAFNVEGNQGPVTIVHYLYEKVETESGYQVRTIAEVANRPDQWVIDEGDVIGLYRFQIPKIGKYLRFFRSPIGSMVLIVDVMIIYLIYKVIDDGREGGNRMDQY